MIWLVDIYQKGILVLASGFVVYCLVAHLMSGAGGKHSIYSKASSVMFLWYIVYSFIYYDAISEAASWYVAFMIVPLVIVGVTAGVLIREKCDR